MREVGRGSSSSNPHTHTHTHTHTTPTTTTHARWSSPPATTKCPSGEVHRVHTPTFRGFTSSTSRRVESGVDDFLSTCGGNAKLSVHCTGDSSSKFVTVTAVSGLRDESPMLSPDREKEAQDRSSVAQRSTINAPHTIPHTFTSNPRAIQHVSISCVRITIASTAKCRVQATHH